MRPRCSSCYIYEFIGVREEVAKSAYSELVAGLESIDGQ